MEEPKEEEIVEEEEVTTMVDSTFIASIVIKMGDLNKFVLKGKETPLKQILANMKLRTLKICLSQVTVLKPEMILYGNWIVATQIT